MVQHFNPPPGWPPVPPGWTPPPDWKPDPAWPEPPTGWQLWVDKPLGGQAIPWLPSTLTASFSAANYWMLGGSIALVLASMLPFVSLSGPAAYLAQAYLLQADIGATARLLIALYGLAMVGLTFVAARTGSQRKSPLPIVLLGMASLAIVGFLLFLAVGSAGVTGTGAGLYGATVGIGYGPNIGVMLAIAGCVVVIASAIHLIRNPTPHR